MKSETGGSQPNPRTGGNGNRVGGASSGLPERTQQAGERIRQQAVGKIEHAKESAKERVGETRHRVSKQIRKVSDALRTTSDNLREEDNPMARYADMACERLDRVADYVETSDADRIFREAEDYARRQPALVYGGAFVLGLAAARFLKSTGADDSPGEEYAPPGVEPMGPDTPRAYEPARVSPTIPVGESPPFGGGSEEAPGTKGGGTSGPGKGFA